MNKYLCIQRSKPGNDAPPSPADMEKLYARFNSWLEKHKGSIVDMGGRLRDGKVVTASSVTDGPFAESSEVVGGYMIVRAESLDQALVIARESPGTFSPGSSVEVRLIDAS